MRLLRRLLAVMAMTAVLMALIQTPAHAYTPSIGDGTCWQGNYTCIWNWDGENYPIHIRLIDDFSDNRSDWGTYATDAANNWTAADGPQLVCWCSMYHEVWTFIEDDSTLPYYVQGITWNCPPGGGACHSDNNPINIYYSSVYINSNIYDGSYHTNLMGVLGHELGHAMGLQHNTNYLEPSIMAPSISSSNRSSTPTSHDEGSGYPCQYSVGMRCIYNWHP